MIRQEAMTPSLPLLTVADKQKRWFITGGAGFIGSHVVDLLVSANCAVTVYDNLSSSTDQYLRQYIQDGKITFNQSNLLDLETLQSAMVGHDIVWHLGANTDIPSGFTRTRMDLDNDVIATWNVLEAMKRNHIEELLFASTGAVYGESIQEMFKESSGPLLPLSLYGAGKVACEAFVSAYCSLFDLRAWIFRFGNVIGGRSNHGIIFDFMKKLKNDPATLEILGTGQGEKNYFLVEECIQGILYVYHQTNGGPWPVLINLGADSRSKIMEIAQIVQTEMGLKDVAHTFTGTPRGWPGDQPVVLLDTAKVHQLGWQAKYTSNEAVSIAVRRLLGKETFMLTTDTVL